MAQPGHDEKYPRDERIAVRCALPCWCSHRTIKYYPGDTDNIHPLEPIGQKFTGWPPGTVVYHKVRGMEGTRVIPGGTPVEPELKPVIEYPCPNPGCGKVFKAPIALASHSRTCKFKVVEPEAPIE